MTLLLFLAALHSGEAPTQKGEVRVGAIHVYGNIVTDNTRILEALGIFAGQRMPSSDDLEWAEMRLLVAFQKRFDLINHVRPRVFVRAAQGSNFQDVWVLFPEKPGVLANGKRSAQPRIELNPVKSKPDH